MDYKEKIAEIICFNCPACDACTNSEFILCSNFIGMLDQILNIRVKDCEMCEGEGQINAIYPRYEVDEMEPCPNCQGTGGWTIQDLIKEE